MSWNPVWLLFGNGGYGVGLIASTHIPLRSRLSPFANGLPEGDPDRSVFAEPKPGCGALTAQDGHEI